jgi:hypothetical protein
MPFAFPSHQGLIAPLWRRWPALFDAPALCVGAAMPDVIDGFVGAWRGHLGQNIGHSLAGLAVFCIPGGLILWYGLHTAAHRVRPTSRTGFLARSWNLGLDAFVHGIPPASFTRQWRRVTGCVALGSLSHLLIDLISHGGFPWLMPWVPKIRIFPEWWYTTWTSVQVPGYHEPYEIGPHFIVWATLSVLGIYLLFRPAFREKTR